MMSATKRSATSDLFGAGFTSSPIHDPGFAYQPLRWRRLALVIPKSQGSVFAGATVGGGPTPRSLLASLLAASQVAWATRTRALRTDAESIGPRITTRTVTVAVSIHWKIVSFPIAYTSAGLPPTSVGSISRLLPVKPPHFFRC